MQHPYRDIPSAERPFSLGVPDYFEKSRLSGWRLTLYEIIFESDTSAGKTFDVGLILAILISVIVVMLESIGPVREEYGPALIAAAGVHGASSTNRSTGPSTSTTS